MATCVGKDFNDELTCALCLDSWRKPVECVPCGHIYCRECLPKTAKTCPLCRGQIVSLKEPHRALTNLCEQVQVECQGCHWVGTRAQSYTHVCTRKKSSATLAPDTNTGNNGLQSRKYTVFMESDEHEDEDDIMGKLGIDCGGYDFSMLNPGKRDTQPWTKYSLSEDEYKDCMTLFDAFDESGNGALNFAEVFKMCRVLNYAHGPTEVAKLFAEMDADGNNLISKDELLTWMSRHKPDHATNYGMTINQYRSAAKQFREFDRDGDGWVNESDFASLCRATRIAASDKEAKSVFKSLDKDRNGLINLSDYLKAYEFREL